MAAEPVRSDPVIDALIALARAVLAARHDDAEHRRTMVVVEGGKRGGRAA